MEQENETTWHEDEGFWETFEPALFPDSRVEAAVREIDALLELTGLQPPAKVLDLCCGVGRHSLELARRGFPVTGVDRTQGYLDRARGAATSEDLAATFVHRDAREFVEPKAFDAAVSLFTSFGYFDDAGNGRVLDNVAASLRPGGVFVIDVLGRENLAKRFRPRDWDRLPDGSLFVQERELLDNWRSIRNEWMVVGDHGVRRFTVSHRVYAGDELAKMFRDHGFDDVRVYGSLAAGPYDHTATRLVVTGRRS